MKAYLMWYQIDEYSAPEYIYIIAVSIKQARYFFYINNYDQMYDFSYNPIDVIDSSSFVRSHKIGDILGQYATL